MTSRRTLFVPLAGLAAFGLHCATRAPVTEMPASDGSAAVSTAAAPLSTWVWEKDTLLARPERGRLLSFLKARGVSTLFVHASPALETDAGFEALAEIVGAGARQGLRVTLVAGDPRFSLPRHHADAVAVIDRARRVEDRLIARGLGRLGGVLFDIEPYLLPEWKSSPQAVAETYADVISKLKSAADGASLEIWQTIPFWFHERAIRGTSLDRLALGASDGVVLMAYRNRAADVEALATPILERASALGKHVIVAVETACVPPPHITFCGRSPRELHDALLRIGSRLRSSKAFAGLGVHQYAFWRKLEDSSG